VTMTITQENLDVYGSADIPWSVPLAQLESGVAERAKSRHRAPVISSGATPGAPGATAECSGR